MQRRPQRSKHFPYTTLFRDLIGSVKPEIGTTWGDIDAFVEIIRGFGGFFVKIPPNPTKSGAEKEET